jgi:hypothetical protein
MDSITVSRQNTITFNRFNIYFGHNMYSISNTDNDYKKTMIDSKMSNINIIENIEFECVGFDSKVRKERTRAHFNILNGKFSFDYEILSDKYDDTSNKKLQFEITYTTTLNPLETIYNPHEDRFKTIINIKPLDVVSNDYFEIFITNMNKFIRTKINGMSGGEEDIKIYCNDEGYWDELQTKPGRPMNTVYLPHKDKTGIINDVNKFIAPETKVKYQKLGRTHKRVYLFEGIPGSGKTTFISALAARLGYDIAMISFTDKVTDGKLLRLIRTLPEKTFLVLEDIDCLFEERKKNDGHKNTVTFSGILNALDGIATPNNFICFMTTNYKCNLDSALLRPGRIDKILKFEHIKKKQVKEIYFASMEDSTKYENDDESNTMLNADAEAFYKAFQELNIKAPVALIQEYLFVYLDEPDSALENIDEMKDIYDASFKKGADMYM